MDEPRVPTTFDELVRAIQPLFPEATLHHGRDDEIVIYTGLVEEPPGNLKPIKEHH